MNEIWQEVATLVDELQRISKSQVSSSQFHQALLDRIIPATSAVAAVVWTCVTEPGKSSVARMDCHAGLPPQLVAGHGTQFDQHKLLAQQAMDEGQFVSGNLPSFSDSINCLGIYAPFTNDAQCVGVIELIFKCDAAFEQRRRAERLLSVIGDILSDFHRSELIRQYRDKEQRQRKLASFSRRIWSQSEFLALCYTIANEGRSVLDCDRLTLLIVEGDRCRVQSVSGVDTIDRRSSFVARLESLAQDVMTLGNVQWCSRSTDGSSPVVQQVDDVSLELRQLIQESNVELIGLVPLALPSDHTERAVSGGIHRSCIGLLVVEMFDGPVDSSRLANCTNELVDCMTPVLSHAIQVNTLPLISLSRRLRGWSQKWNAQRKSSGHWIAMLAVVIALAAVSWPVEFTVEGRGELQPVEQSFVYAPRDGVVTALPAFQKGLDAGKPAGEGIQVSAGDVLIELESAPLDYELTTALGERAITLRQIETISITLEQMGRASGATTTAGHFDELTAQKLELEAKLESLGKRIDILQSEKDELVIRAALTGQVQTWDVVGQLKARPVRQGQRLVSIAHTEGPWRLDIYIQDRHIGYVYEARQNIEPKLPVRFVVNSDPQQVHKGWVGELAMSAEVNEPHGISVRAVVSMDRSSDFAKYRPGTSVFATIHCGKRPLWRVLFRDLIHSVRRHLNL